MFGLLILVFGFKIIFWALPSFSKKNVRGSGFQQSLFFSKRAPTPASILNADSFIFFHDICTDEIILGRHITIST